MTLQFLQDLQCNTPDSVILMPLKGFIQLPTVSTVVLDPLIDDLRTLVATMRNDNGLTNLFSILFIITCLLLRQGLSC